MHWSEVGKLNKGGKSREREKSRREMIGREKKGGEKLAGTGKFFWRYIFFGGEREPTRNFIAKRELEILYK